MKNAMRTLLLLLVASQGTTLSAQSKVITKQEFNEAVENFEKTYIDAGIPEAHNLPKFRIKANWSDGAVWFAPRSRRKGRGNLEVPGGLARRLGGGADVLTLAICREMGYLFAGYPAFRRSNPQLMANVGNSSYYSTFACTTLLWQNHLEKNAASRTVVTPEAQAFCDGIYPDSIKAQNLCYRKVIAAAHLSRFVNRDKPVFIDQPSTKVVEKTMDKIVKGQCLFDTYLAGIACKAYERWDHNSLPKNEADMAKTSCASRSYPSDPAETIRQGLRPRCWYAPPAGQ